MWRRTLEQIWVQMLGLVYPARCAGCDSFVAEETSFCDVCRPEVVPLVAACPFCAEPGEERGHKQGRARCACAGREFHFDSARAALVYTGATVPALLRFKHAGRRDVARSLARYLAAPLRDAVQSAAGDPAARPSVLVTPVPLHPRRLRQRGYNQALELIRAVLAVPGPSSSSGPLRGAGVPARLVPDLLVRLRNTPPMGKLGVSDRRNAVEGVFASRRDLQADRPAVVLVDDVMTTGATLSACARALKRAGAGRVEVVALARAL